MRELVFLLEERSASALLESMLPRMLDQSIAVRFVPFEGKQDLEKQLTRRIRAYQNLGARFIVLRDQDSNPDCIAVKRRLLALCAESGKANKCLVRIACRELETIYLADLLAVEQGLAMQGLARHQHARKFRAPDRLGSPGAELKKLTGSRYEKVAGSRAIGRHIDLGNERSPTFRNLIAAVRRMEQELLVEQA